MSGLTFAVARGTASGDWGAIAQSGETTLAPLAEDFRRAQAKDVTFTFDELSRARAALNAAKTALKDVQAAKESQTKIKAARAAVASARARVDKMKRAPWITFGIYTGSRRDRASLQWATCFVGDADQGAELQPLLTRLDALAVSYITHTSTSHGCEGQERYRIIIPFARPIEPSHYPAVWESMNKALGGVLDPGAKDPTRLSYMPRVPIGATGHQVICVDDRPWFDASTITAVANAPPPDTEPQTEALTDITDEQLADLKSALSHPALLEAAADNGFWTEIGYALLSLGAQGFELFRDFSQAAPNYEPDAPLKWWTAHESAAPPRSDFRHVYKLAAAVGWINPEHERRSQEANKRFGLIPEPAQRQLRLQTTAKGHPLSNVHNAAMVLAKQTTLSLAYDEFLGRAKVQWPGESPRPLQDEDVTRVQIELQRLGMTAMSGTAARDALYLIARKHTVNCVQDYLNGLEWDRTRRLSLLFPNSIGTPADRYHVRAGRNMLIAMAARALHPGCKVDEAVVLQGEQGKKKSQWFEILGGDYYRELTADPRSKDFEQQLLGVWLGEFPELNAMRRTDDIARLKQFITCRVDHYRPTYGRENRDCPRHTVLCGSTNEDQWAHDPTGARRFIPVEVGSINLDWLRDNRDQLFAEAVALYKAGRKWWIYPREATAEMQAARQPGDPWESKISGYLHGRIEIGDVGELLDHVIGVPTDRQTHAQLTRVGILLRKLGCKQQSRRRIDGERRRPWSIPPEFSGQPLTSNGPTTFAPIANNLDLIGNIGGAA